MDPFWFRWWAPPLGFCLVVTGMLGYLGTHVVARKVIFVDLATAQIAALGTAYGILLGYEPGHAENEVPLYLFSLGFALAGAAIMTFTRMRKDRVPHEAFIGICYASATALAILVLSRSGSEKEQVKEMMVGSLLTVRWPKVGITAGIYAAIGAFHWFFREKFFLITRDPEEAEKAGVSVRFWDFMFYISFGVVITSSVAVAGVLLVFSYLVIPAVIAVMFSDRTRIRILICWAVGTLVSFGGMNLSYNYDFPPGPSIVAAFTAALVLAGLAHFVRASENPGLAAGKLLAGLGVAALALWGTTFLRKHEETHGHEGMDAFTILANSLESDNENTVIESIHEMEKLKDAHAVAPLVKLLKTNPKERVVEHASKALAGLGSAEAVGPLKDQAKRDLDDDLRITIARSILDLHDPGGLPILIEVVEKGEAPLPKKEAKALIEERTGLKFDDPGALEKLKKWWAERGPSLKWQGQTRRFE